MIKQLGLIFIFLSIIFCFSCKKNSLLTDPSAKLEFSLDTVIFDTVFTQIGSITKGFKVYNPHVQPINITSIHLAGGSESNFRINIDGISSTVEKDIELRAEDSIYIFVEVTVDPNNVSNPMIITDSVLFETNGNIQDIDLVAWGQDAYFWFSTKGEYFFPIEEEEVYNTNYVLPNDKPHIVYGYLTVDSTNILTLQAGTNMHFHQFSGLAVGPCASLKVEGTIDNPVLFTSDRLDFDYRDIPGQWGHPSVGGIWLTPTSVDNEINYAIIKNGNIGLEVDSFKTNSPSLLLQNTIIENMSGVGLFAKGAIVEASNCIFGNCGQFTAALAYGGDYLFNHCTFSNYWSFGARDNGQLFINNYFEDINGNIQSRHVTRAEFNNCIIYGSKDEELVLDETNSDGFDFNYLFNNCVLKTSETTSGDQFVNVINNPAPVLVDGQSHDPVFDNPTAGDYHLFDQSVARNEGTLISGLESDLEQNTRDLNPDLGALEFVQ